MNLINVADGCGFVRGTQLWFEHLDNPDFGMCRFCDDVGSHPSPPFPYRPEYRKNYCPEQLTQ